MDTQVFDTKPLLRPDQAQAAREEIASLEAKMTSPHIQDKGEVYRQLQRSKKLYEQQIPKPPANADEEGRMVARSRQLLNEILTGMPSQEEMRKAPPGAVDKHRSWEGRNKARILEWKNLQLRLRPGERDAANLEKHRPTASTLNMDNAQIQGKQFFMPATNGPAVVFSQEQIEYLKSLGFEPSLMSNDQRSAVKDHIENGIGLANAKQGKPKRTMSPEQKAAMKAGRQRKAAEKAAKE